MTERTGQPAFTGLDVHRDLTYRYSLLYPTGWHVAELAVDEGAGAILAPEAGETLNSLSVAARDLGTTVTADDLDALREGFTEGLAKIPAVTVISQNDWAIGDSLGLDAIFTYRDGGATRQRWVRLVYRGTIEVRLIAQGATPAEYAYWLPMFTQAMRTFQFADWWAEATGEQWLPNLNTSSRLEPDEGA